MQQTWQGNATATGAVNASASFTKRRGQPWVVGAYVALTKSLKDQCPPALNGAVKRDIEFLPNFTDQLALGIWMPLIFS